MEQAELLSIDTGFRYFGYAVFGSEGLIHAGLSKDTSTSDDWDIWTKQPPSFLHVVNVIKAFEWVESPRAVIEYPKMRRDTPNPEAIVKLSAACGALTGILQAGGFSVLWVEPHSWKGSVKKDVFTKRLLAKIPQCDYCKIENIKDHNILDAVGIGLWQRRKS